MNLTPQQTVIAELVTRGMSNLDIAKEMKLSEGTVKEYLHRMFRRIGVPNRTGLAVWVFEQHKKAAE